eukprot:986860-Pleurochrysis_carterae.AAC.1
MRGRLSKHAELCSPFAARTDDDAIAVAGLDVHDNASACCLAAWTPPGPGPLGRFELLCPPAEILSCVHAIAQSAPCCFILASSFFRRLSPSK